MVFSCRDIGIEMLRNDEVLDFVRIVCRGLKNRGNAKREFTLCKERATRPKAHDSIFGKIRMVIEWVSQVKRSPIKKSSLVSSTSKSMRREIIYQTCW